MQAEMARSRPTPPADPNVRTLSWAAEGVVVGAVGAAAVALFFGVVDLVGGRLFWTPFALGSATILGRLPEPGAAIEPVLVAGYTAIHLAGFIAVGSFAAFRLLSGSPPPGPVSTQALVLAGLFWVALEAMFLGFFALFAAGGAALLGYERVALANGLAAAAMAGWLCARAERRAPGVD